MRNLQFPKAAFNNPGILLTGMILDNKGNINRVFTFNSLDTTIDNMVLNLLESTQGHWAAIENSEKKNEIIVIPFIFTLKNTEEKLNRNNFKKRMLEEVIVSARDRDNQQMNAIGYHSTKNVMKKLNRLMNSEKYQEAYPYVVQLLQREPLNSDFYAKLIILEDKLKNQNKACQNLKFVQANFLQQPDENLINQINCN